MIDQVRHRLKELERKTENVIAIGTISETDHAAGQVRIKIGEIVTAPLPWPADQGRNYTRWRPLRVGQQVVVACPSGDPAQAVVIAMLYTETLTRPSADPELDVIDFESGTRVTHSAKTGDVTVAGAGKVTLTSAGDMTLTAGGNFRLSATRIDLN